MNSSSTESTDEVSEKEEESLVTSAKSEFLEKLNTYSNRELSELLASLEEENVKLAKENEFYDFFLKEEEYLSAQITLLAVESSEEDMSYIKTKFSDINIMQQSTEDQSHVLHILTYPEKCYVLNKKLEQLKKHLADLYVSQDMQTLEDLQLQVHALEITEAEVKEAMQDFSKQIRVNGRHPVTKRIIAEKVSKYFDDNFRDKMTWTEKYRMQIESDKIQRSRLLSQIKDKEEMSAKVDYVEFQKTNYESMKSNKLLAMYNKKHNKLRARVNWLLQCLTEQKKLLEKEEADKAHMQSLVSRQEYLEEIILSEKEVNDKKIEELKAAMRKVKLDPRRHNLPSVMDYALLKTEEAKVQKSMKEWTKKMALAEQSKFLYLSALQHETG